jgi:hypothetical protein
LAERFGYQHIEDFLDDMPNGAELTGLSAYLTVDDEVKTQQTAYAIIKAFNGDKKQQAAKRHEEPEEEIIDTTDPEFARLFRGINYVQPQPQRRFSPNSNGNTEIKIG